MKIQQLSIFLENKPGHLEAACKTMADAGINLMTLNLADTCEFGILRVIVKDPEGAKSILEKNGFTVKLTDMLAASVADKPGGLLSVLSALSKADVNVDYMYAFAYRKGDAAVMMIRADHPDIALNALTAAGVTLLSRKELLEDA